MQPPAPRSRAPRSRTRASLSALARPFLLSLPLTVGALVALGALGGCALGPDGGGPPIADPAPPCIDDSGCLATTHCDLARGACVPNEFCGADGVSPCAPGQVCVEDHATFTCQAADAIAGCVISPATLTLVDGEVAHPEIVALDAHGDPLPESARRDPQLTLPAPLDPVGPVSDGVWRGRCEGPARCGGVVSAAFLGADRVGDAIAEVACRTNVVVVPARAAADVRVRVVDASTREPLAGARVNIVALDDTAAALNAVSDPAGVAQVTYGIDARFAITASLDDFVARTLVTRAREVVLALRPLEPATQLAGAHGAIDGSGSLAMGDVQIGHAGFPLSDLVDGLDFRHTLGVPASTNVVIENLTGPEGSIVGHVSNATLALGRDTLIGPFTAIARPGARMPWAFASRATLMTAVRVLAAVAQQEHTSAMTFSIELLRLMDESIVATLAPSIVVGAPVLAPTDPLDVAATPLAEIGEALAPRTFSSTELFVAVPAVPQGIDSIILMALVELPTQGFVPIGVRFLGDDDGDGIAEDDQRPLATQHSLFVSPPTGALAGWPMHIVVIAQSRAQLEAGAMSDTRLFVPIAPGATGLVQLPRADFLSPPNVVLEDDLLSVAHEGSRAVLRLTGSDGVRDVVLDGPTGEAVALADVGLTGAALEHARAELVDDAGHIIATAE